MTEPTMEERAAEMGWIPEAEFRGDKTKWVDAETYVERGTNLLPIVQASERKLREQLKTTAGELSTLKTTVNEQREAIETLVKHNSEENRKKMKDSLDATKTKLVEARSEGNHAEAIELEAVLDEQREALKEAEAAPPEKKVETSSSDEAYLQSPEWKEWVAENPWYGTDKRKTALSMAIGDELRSDPETKNLTGKAFLDKVTEEVEKTLGGEPRRPSKVESGGRANGSGGRMAESKSYSDLPADARAECDADAKRLVGPNRAFKNVEEWRQKYTQDYFAQE